MLGEIRRSRSQSSRRSSEGAAAAAIPLRSPPPLVVAKEPTGGRDAQRPVRAAPPSSQDRRDTGRRPQGVTVNWSTATGSLAPTSGPTGGDGIAASSWTLGPTAGAQSAQATVAGADRLAGHLRRHGHGLTAAAGAGQGADCERRCADRACQRGAPERSQDHRDAGRQPPSGRHGDLVHPYRQPGADIRPDRRDGIAASSWTLGPTAGAQSAQATVAGATGSPVTFSATATAGPPPPPPRHDRHHRRQHLLPEQQERDLQYGGGYGRGQRDGHLDVGQHGRHATQCAIHRYDCLHQQRPEDGQRPHLPVPVHAGRHVHVQLRGARQCHDRSIVVR